MVKAVVGASYAALAASALSSILMGSFNPAVAAVTLFYLLLIVSFSCGANSARIGYVALDVLMTIPPLFLSGPPSPAPWVNVILFIASVAIWLGLFHKDVRAWFRDVKTSRLAAPVDEQVSMARLELKLSLAWFLGALATGKFLFKAGAGTAPAITAFLVPFVVVGVLIAVTQAVRIHRLNNRTVR